MEHEFTKLIEQIMELLVNDDYISFLADNGKFHFIDKNRNINFQATLGNFNYYLRDNITNNTLIVTRKHIGEGIFIRNILMSNGNDQDYIAFFTKGDYPGLIKIISKDKNDSLVCSNPDCIEAMENEADLRGYINAFFEEEIDDEDLENEENDIDEDMTAFQKLMSDLSENNNDDYMDESQPPFQEDDSTYDLIDDEDDSMFENEFQVIINGKEIEGEEKIKAITSCAIDLTNRHNRLKDIEMFAENLKLLIEDLTRDNENER